MSKKDLWPRFHDKNVNIQLEQYQEDMLRLISILEGINSCLKDANAEQHSIILDEIIDLKNEISFNV